MRSLGLNYNYLRLTDGQGGECSKSDELFPTIRRQATRAIAILFYHYSHTAIVT